LILFLMASKEFGQKCQKKDGSYGQYDYGFDPHPHSSQVQKPKEITGTTELSVTQSTSDGVEETKVDFNYNHHSGSLEEYNSERLFEITSKKNESRSEFVGNEKYLEQKKVRTISNCDSTYSSASTTSDYRNLKQKRKNKVVVVVISNFNYGLDNHDTEALKLKMLWRILEECLKLLVEISNGFNQDNISSWSDEKKMNCFKEICDCFHKIKDYGTKKNLACYLRQFRICQSTDKDFAELDLHWLEWEDAEIVFDEVRSRIQKSMKKNTGRKSFGLKVITGKGNNSLHKTPSLLPQLKNKLAKERTVHDLGDGYVLVTIA